MASAANFDEALTQWRERLQQLIDEVKGWVEAEEWSTRSIEISKEDSEFGVYKAPALLLQREATRILLEPISRDAPNVDAVVDLYLMPAYDDIASLYHDKNGWRIHYMFPDAPTVGDIREAESRPLTRESLSEVIDEMTKNAV